MIEQSDYSKEASLGDILSAALGRKNMVDVNKVVTFIRAARDTGRSNREVLDMLTDNEISDILDKATEVKVVQNTFASDRRTVNARVENCGKIVRKIDAIKMVRDECGTGLLEAKQFVEGTRTLALTKAEYNAINAALSVHGNVFLTS